MLALAALFTIAGIAAFRHLPVEAYPDVTNVSLQVITLFPGHAAEEVERLVTIPIENEMNGIPKRTSIRSISLFGLSQVTITFEDDADNEFVRSQAAQHLAVVTLPSGAQASLSPNATPIGEIYRYTLKAPKGFPDVELKALQDWVVEKQFRTVPGIVDVVGFGGPIKQYQVLIDPVKLRSYGITLNQIFTALSNGNRNAGGSYIEHGTELYIVRGLGFIQDLNDIGNIAVDTRNGTPIKISDLGTVQIGNQLRLGRVGKIVPGQPDQDDVVMGIVIMRRGENALEVLKRVRAKVDDINQNYLPAGVKIVPHYDRTDLTQRTLHTARKNMIEGISLVLLVLILFLGLGNFRSALVVAVVVPLSLLGAFLLLDLRGIPANLISLGAIDFGIIVDSAVVIIEDLLHLLEQDPTTNPKLASDHHPGRVTNGQADSLLESHFADRVHSALHSATRRRKNLPPDGSDADLRAGGRHDSRPDPRSGAGQLRLQKQGLSNKSPGLSIGSSACIARCSNARCTLAALFLRRRRGCFGHCRNCARQHRHGIPAQTGRRLLWVRGFMPQTIAPTESDRLSQHVRGILASFPEVRTVVTQLGRPDDGTDINGWDIIECAVELKDRSEWKTAPNREGLVDAMNRKLSRNTRNAIPVQPIYRRQRQRSHLRHQSGIEHQDLRRRPEQIAGVGRSRRWKC